MKTSSASGGDKSTLSSLLERHQLQDKRCIDQRITEIHLDQISHSCCRQWRRMPTYLEMDAIVGHDANLSTSDEAERRSLFLLKWRGPKGPGATYRKLMEALVKIECVEDADKVVLYCGVPVVITIVAVLITKYLTTTSILPSLPHSSPNFIGREHEISELRSTLEYTDDSPMIITILGSPGCGKSELAIYLGHELESEGTDVIYMDMNQMGSMYTFEFIEAKISHILSRKMSILELYKWSSSLSRKTLFIFDNWDPPPDSDSGDLGDIILKLSEQKSSLKIIVTSRERKLYSESKHQLYLIDELPQHRACQLLCLYSKSVTEPICKEMTAIAGCMPLTLHAIGEILNGTDPPQLDRFVSSLKEDLISVTSSVLVNSTTRVNESIFSSYQHLTPDEQLIGRLLSYFPAAFTADGVLNIVPEKHKSIHAILRSLVKKSLLHVRGHEFNIFKYEYPKIIKAFFNSMSMPAEARRFNANYLSYYILILNKIMEQKSAFEFKTIKHVFVNFVDYCKNNELVDEPFVRVSDSLLSRTVFSFEDIEVELQTLLSYLKETVHKLKEN